MDNRIYLIQLRLIEYSDYTHCEYGYVVGKDKADALVEKASALLKKAAVAYCGEDGEGPWDMGSPAVAAAFAEIAPVLGVVEAEGRAYRRDWCDKSSEIRAVELKRLGD